MIKDTTMSNDLMTFWGHNKDNPQYCKQTNSAFGGEKAFQAAP